MENVRQTLINAMRARLTTATQGMPGSIAMATPLGPLAEAAMEVLSGGMRIPTIAPYNTALAPERRWYGILTTDALDEGATYPAIGVTREGDQVVLHIQHGAHTFDLALLPTDGADFGLSVASAAYADAPDSEVAVRKTDTAR